MQVFTVQLFETFYGLKFFIVKCGGRNPTDSHMLWMSEAQFHIGSSLEDKQVSLPKGSSANTRAAPTGGPSLPGVSVGSLHRLNHLCWGIWATSVRPAPSGDDSRSRKKPGQCWGGVPGGGSRVRWATGAQSATRLWPGHNQWRRWACRHSCHRRERKAEHRALWPRPRWGHRCHPPLGTQCVGCPRGLSRPPGHTPGFPQMPQGKKAGSPRARLLYEVPDTERRSFWVQVSSFCSWTWTTFASQCASNPLLVSTGRSGLCSLCDTSGFILRSRFH